MHDPVGHDCPKEAVLFWKQVPELQYPYTQMLPDETLQTAPLLFTLHSFVAPDVVVIKAKAATTT